jgi:hypothetical protein
MDERKIVDAIGNLTGVITALEMQMQALLAAASKAGMDPADVRHAIDAMPEPAMPSLGRSAYNRAMAGFQRCLEEMALQRDRADRGPQAGAGAAREGDAAVGGGLREAPQEPQDEH